MIFASAIILCALHFIGIRIDLCTKSTHSAAVAYGTYTSGLHFAFQMTLTDRATDANSSARDGVLPIFRRIEGNDLMLKGGVK